MHAPPLPGPDARWQRVVTALLLMSTLLAWVLGTTVPAHADQPLDPVKRAFFNIYQIVVHDDRDWGSGEIRITLRVWKVNEGCPADSTSGACITQLMKTGNLDFRADSGDAEQVNVAFPSGPQAGDTLADGVTSRYGIPLYPGQVYGWEIRGVEVDPVSDDNLGVIRGTMTAENNWGFGVRTEKSDAGYFSARFEILTSNRFPNLKPTAIERIDGPAGASLVCATIANTGGDAAGPFQTIFRQNGAAVSNGTADAGGLAAGASGQLCITTALPSTERQRWSVTVDEARTVIETDEYDNILESGLLGTGPSTSTEPSTSTSPTPAPKPAGTPTPSAPTADLAVGAIKMNGQAPDGKGDCKDGKNSVAVLIKNVGEADAGRFTVRLVVDGDVEGALERAVNGLADDKEREVRFGDVRLKKGEHTLAVSLATGGSAPDANEENDSRSVTVTCQGAS